VGVVSGDGRETDNGYDWRELNFSWHEFKIPDGSE
jgi:hypothetical protein